MASRRKSAAARPRDRRKQVWRARAPRAVVSAFAHRPRNRNGFAQREMQVQVCSRRHRSRASSSGWCRIVSSRSVGRQSSDSSVAQLSSELASMLDVTLDDGRSCELDDVAALSTVLNVTAAAPALIAFALGFVRASRSTSCTLTRATQRVESRPICAEAQRGRERGPLASDPWG